MSIFRSTIGLSKHHLKGLYTYTIGSKQGKSKDVPIEIVCTLREGGLTKDEGIHETAGPGLAYGPIALTYQGCCSTLRPWDPTACVIAAGIYNHFIHLPIGPGCRVFVVDCSLRTLSHIADIIGPKGRLVGVLDSGRSQRPTEAELRNFFKRYPNTFVATAEVNTATLEHYERVLSLPEPSKEAFLQGIHPRLGAESPVRLLLQAPDHEVLMRRVFEFLECGDLANVKCLVFCHWAPGTTTETIRDVMLRHMDVLQRWRVPGGAAAAREGPQAVAADEATATDEGALLAEETTEAVAEESMGGNPNEAEAEGHECPQKNRSAIPGGAGPNASSCDEGTTTATDTNMHSQRRQKSDSAVPGSALQWVLLGLPMDRMADSAEPQETSRTLMEVVNAMKRLRSGRRTGLYPKEQLLLAPHFVNYALLLLKYSSHRDESRNGGAAASSSSKKERGEAATKSAPKHDVIPMPSFAKQLMFTEDSEKPTTATAKADSAAANPAKAAAGVSRPPGFPAQHSGVSEARAPAAVAATCSALAETPSWDLTPLRAASAAASSTLAEASPWETTPLRAASQQFASQDYYDSEALAMLPWRRAEARSEASIGMYDPHVDYIGAASWGPTSMQGLGGSLPHGPSFGPPPGLRGSPQQAAQGFPPFYDSRLGAGRGRGGGKGGGAKCCGARASGWREQGLPGDLFQGAGGWGMPPELMADHYYQ